MSTASSSSDFTDIGPEYKFACLSELPSLPALLMDALQQLEGHQNMASVTTLVDKIGHDPALVARLLRIANSSFYGMSREIASLREAIVVLGFNRVRDLLISICFSKALMTHHKNFNYKGFWHHSMAVADCSRQLAGRIGINTDIAFTAGVLHDIGQLVIVFLFPYPATDPIFNAPNTLLHAGKQIDMTENKHLLLCSDHAEIGGKAALYWNFPVAIQKAIEQHETAPLPGAAKSLGLLIYTVNLLMTEIMPWDDCDIQNRQESLRVALEILDIPIEQARLSADTGRQFADRIVAVL